MATPDAGNTHPFREHLIDLATWLSEQTDLDVGSPDEAVDLYLDHRENNSRHPFNERVRTADGWHGRIRGANGEPVWTTEVLEDPRDVSAAYAVAANAITVGVVDVDER